MYNRISLVFMLIVCFAVHAETAKPQWVSVKLDAANSIDARIHWPSIPVPRAVVVVVPGTGGLSDPMFDRELSAVHYDTYRRGGLTQALANAGYISIFYSHRGIRRLEDCVTGVELNERIDSYISKCFDKKVRTLTHFKTISEDTAKIFQFAGSNALFQGLPIIALAYSEGLHHVAEIVNSIGVNIRGVVTIGGVTASISDIVRFQWRREYYISAAYSALKKCDKSALTVVEVLSCSGAPVTSQAAEEFRRALGISLINRASLNSREQYWNNFYQTLKSETLLARFQPYTSGTFMGRPVTENWAGDYVAQMLEASISAPIKLSRQRMPLLYLLGSLDTQVPLKPPVGCEANVQAREIGSACRFKVINGMDHILTDGSRTIPPKSLREIVQGLAEVIAMNAGKI